MKFLTTGPPGTSQRKRERVCWKQSHSTSIPFPPLRRASLGVFLVLELRFLKGSLRTCRPRHPNLTRVMKGGPFLGHSCQVLLRLWGNCKLMISQFHLFIANRWGNNGNSEKLYFLGSKITADGDCSHKIKRCLLLARKAMTILDSILKSRDITLPTQVCLVKAMVFPVVMCGCESWTIKKAQHWRIDVFELWCWRRLLRVPWTPRKSN